MSMANNISLDKRFCVLYLKKVRIMSHGTTSLCHLCFLYDLAFYCVLFFFFIDLCKCFLFSCFVFVYFIFLICIMHSAFNLFVFPNYMFTSLLFFFLNIFL